MDKTSLASPPDHLDDSVDVALVGRMVTRDMSALSELYARHSVTLFRIALCIVRDRQEAEDLLHNVFLEAWREAAAFDPSRGRVRTWLAVRMRSRTLDRISAMRISRRVYDFAFEDVESSEVPASPDCGHVRDALEQLSPDRRRVLELAYFEGLTRSEIAQRLSLPIGTVKSRHAAAVRALRKRLDARVAA